MKMHSKMEVKIMKKVFSLIMVLALVLCLATAAFAAESTTLTMGDNTATSETADYVTYTWTTESDGVLSFTFGGDWACVVTDAEGNVMNPWSQNVAYVRGMMSITVDVTAGTYTIQIGSYDAMNDAVVAGSLDFNVSFCNGSKEAPFVLPAAYYDPTAHSGKWFYVKAAADAKLIVQSEGVVVTDAEGNVLENNAEDPWMGPMLVIELAAGEEVYLNISNVEGAEYSGAYFNYVEKGGYDYPYEAVLGENTATSSADSGMPVYFSYTPEVSGLLTLTITDAETGWTYMLWNWATKDSINDPDATSSGSFVEAGQTYVFGVAAFAADEYGFGAVADGTVTFELSIDTQGTENDPIFIESEVSSLQTYAGYDIYYAFSSRLNGAIVKIAVDENLVVTVNDEVVEADGGYVTFTLNSVPVTKVVLTNNGWGDIAYDVYFEYPQGSYNNPISVNVPSDLTSATVDAGSETWYAVSSRLDGYTLTVKGEGAYVIVNGEKVEAVDGVVTVTLEAKGATIPVVIGNAGEAAATYECTIEYVDVAPPTGDMIAVALVMMLTSGTALVSLKKKEN